jgi:hypothetical protein
MQNIAKIVAFALISTGSLVGCGEMKPKETVTVKIDGENLILGDKTYTRYAPK